LAEIERDANRLPITWSRRGLNPAEKISTFAHTLRSIRQSAVRHSPRRPRLRLPINTMLGPADMDYILIMPK